MFNFKSLSYLFLLLSLFVLNSCRTDTKPTETQTAIVTVNTHIRAEPDKLNGILTTRGHSLQVASFIYPTLIEFDPITLELSPMLVKSLPTVQAVTEGLYEGYTAFIYEFLEEAKWDNGQPVLGSDYAFTVKMIKKVQKRSFLY